jgi:Protein of unknown function (DUF1549)/Protein of unknown function (DUF1553)
MTVTLRAHLAISGLLLLASLAQAQSTKPTAAKDLAAKIDERMAKHWKDKNVQPAPVADDAEFLRRVYLDLIGRIPSAGEARQFLADKSPEKRRRLVDMLLDYPRYTVHWMNYWEALLLPESKFESTNGVSRSFEAWVRKQMQSNTAYDKMVRELLTAPVNVLVKLGDELYPKQFQNEEGGTYGGAGGADATPYSYAAPYAVVFYQVEKANPANLAARTSRLFLGVRLECAQCHDHPFAKWKKEQFWNLAAFYAGIEVPDKGVPLRENPNVKPIAMSEGGKVVPARYLDGGDPAWQKGIAGRQMLADWVTSPKNPYFSRAITNRMWANFLGTGLIEPVDEMVGKDVQDNDPGGILDELAQEFVANGFDLKFLMRTITATKVYQATSAKSHASQDNPRMFGRMSVRGLTPEQLYDSVAEAVGDRLPRQQTVSPNAGGTTGTARERFLRLFTSRTEKAPDTSSIPQALAMMNGTVIASATNVSKSRTLEAVLDSPFLDVKGRIETLYLATLSREPRPQELKRAIQFVDEAGSQAEGLADLFWALLNSAEFKLNH